MRTRVRKGLAQRGWGLPILPTLPQLSAAPRCAATGPLQTAPAPLLPQLQHSLLD